MPHAENKVEWCLKKAEKELAAGSMHRGIVRIKPGRELAQSHVAKAEHNLRAMSDFRDSGYSDWSASAAFYAMYHCLLAIISLHGYESRNQECTFALVRKLVADGKVRLDLALVDGIASQSPDEQHELPTVVDIRESGQYGVSLSLEDRTFKRILNLARELLDRTKEILQE